MADLPPQPDEVTMEELVELARRLREHPDNRPGSDKTWVLRGLRNAQRFWRAVRTEGRALDGFPSAAGPPEREARPG